MASTYTSLHFHVVFSTKNREPWIRASWEAALYDYLGGTVQGLGGFSQGIGGMSDHVHLLIGLKATHCLADFMQQLKRASSVWIQKEAEQKGFAWQEGYGAFSVSPSARPSVRRYIAHQKEHHQGKSYCDELIELFNRAGVDYDEKYLW